MKSGRKDGEMKEGGSDDKRKTTTEREDQGVELQTK